MSSLIRFTCEKCDYSLEVSGGIDYGTISVVQTMTCHDCEHLVDVLVGREGQEGPTGDPEYDKDLQTCPICREQRLEIWDKSRQCPKCGGLMTEGEVTCFLD
jgi:ssDNA-binding Zn-finger/Zn-ribbon topoisomerase 1